MLQYRNLYTLYLYTLHIATPQRMMKFAKGILNQFINNLLTIRKKFMFRQLLRMSKIINIFYRYLSQLIYFQKLRKSFLLLCE